MPTTTQVILAVQQSVLADASQISLTSIMDLVCRLAFSLMGIVLIFRVSSSFMKMDVGAIITTVALFAFCTWFVVTPTGAINILVEITKTVVGTVS